MTNLIRFPASRRIPATTVPREDFERLADLALDVVDLIVALLDEAHGTHNAVKGANSEPSLASSEGSTRQIFWTDGGDQDLERI